MYSLDSPSIFHDLTVCDGTWGAFEVLAFVLRGSYLICVNPPEGSPNGSRVIVCFFFISV